MASCRRNFNAIYILYDPYPRGAGKMSEIREWLQAAGRAIKRWRKDNDPANASPKLQWEFVQLGKQVNELEPYWRKDDILFHIKDEKEFYAANLLGHGTMEEVESIFEGQPSMKIFRLPAEKYFELTREQLESLQRAAKPINQSKKD